MDITNNGSHISMYQAKFLEESYQVGPREVISFDFFRSLRTQLAYVTFFAAPDILIFVAMLGQITEERYKRTSAEAMTVLRKVQSILKESHFKDGLNCVYIPPEDIQIAVCVDASFAINYDKTSQLVSKRLEIGLN